MEGISLSKIALTGGRKVGDKNVNAKVGVYSSGPIVIDSLDYSKCSDVYNCLEVNLCSKNVTKTSDSITIKNTTFENLTNNAINIFAMKNGGVVNIEGCTFKMKDGGEAIRLSNYTNARFTVNIKNCTIEYPNGTTEANAKWNKVVLFQNYNDDCDEASTITQLGKITLNFVNTTFEGGAPTIDNVFTAGYNDSTGNFVFLDNKPVIIVDSAEIA